MENEFLLDTLWNLEAAEANLCDDIDFLYTVLYNINISYIMFVFC